MCYVTGTLLGNGLLKYFWRTKFIKILQQFFILKINTGLLAFGGGGGFLRNRFRCSDAEAVHKHIIKNTFL